MSQHDDLLSEFRNLGNTVRENHEKQMNLARKVSNSVSANEASIRHLCSEVKILERKTSDNEKDISHAKGRVDGTISSRTFYLSVAGIFLAIATLSLKVLAGD